MAGHSKWANIRHRKAAQDAKRGKIFTKLIREIVVAARQGGPAPEDNPRLRAAVDKALAGNMKRDTIDKAIARGAGTEGDANYEEVTYEGYGSDGIAILVECMTDNRNRTVAEVRHAFSKRGGNLGTDGSVAYMFERRGQLLYPPETDEVKVLEAAMEAGAEDIVTNDDGSIEVYTAFEDFHAVCDAMAEAGMKPEDSNLTQVAANTITLEESAAENVLGLIDALDELDDTQNVYSNADIPDEVMEKLS